MKIELKEIERGDYIDVVLDLDDPETEERLHRWGGATILRLLVRQGGKEVVAFVSARVSGDIRAGSTDGCHLRMEVNRRNTSVLRQAHALPWRKMKRVTLGTSVEIEPKNHDTSGGV